ncbi:hypothetical protein [Solirubrobacter pauli]|uniref:hypothetical protein n=1 Tax=Solirubrobacter pauli TaxID=166793 RepID=UPI000EB500CF|nr:hypothetical protein [Solirubrobacter pauli]
MGIDEYEPRLRALLSERTSGGLTGEIAWSASIDLAREPVTPPLLRYHESFQLEADSWPVGDVVVSLRRRLAHIDETGDSVESTTFHCELIFDEADGHHLDRVLLDEETDPRVLGVEDLDRHGRGCPGIRRLLTAETRVNIWADGRT